MKLFLSTFAAILAMCLLTESGADSSRRRRIGRRTSERVDISGIEEDLIHFLTSKETGTEGGSARAGAGTNNNIGRNLQSITCPDSDATTRFIVSGGTVEGAKNVGCVAAYARSEYYCPRGGRTHCPNACDTCEKFACEDTRADFLLQDGTEMNCNLNKFSQAAVVRMCKDPQIKNSCRKTCQDSTCPL